MPRSAKYWNTAHPAHVHRQIYSQRGSSHLTIDELAGRLGWQRRIIEEWFLPAQHPRHRQMTRRDFEHFESSIDSIITRQGDRP